MARYPLRLLMVVTTLAAIGATAVHWLWARPSAEEIAGARQARELRMDFAEIPKTFGSWRAVAPEDVEIQLAGGAVLLRREYEHIDTQERVRVMLHGGHMRHISRAQYLVCSDDYKWLGIRRLVGEECPEVHSYKAWINQNEPTQVLWLSSVTKNGEWSAEEDERLHLGFTRRCFKLIVTTDITGDESVEKATNRASGLLQQFVPVANRVLFDAKKTLKSPGDWAE